jgi:uncharacterized membrane protein YsdA (DUF1294 family)
MRFQIQLTFVFLTIIILLAASERLPHIIPAYYLLASVITFFVYARDKAIAGTDERRIPEDTLHMLAVIGGWPGAALAQKHFRHKTVKETFRTVFWQTIAFNLALLGLAWYVGVVDLIGQYITWHV